MGTKIFLQDKGCLKCSNKKENQKVQRIRNHLVNKNKIIKTTQENGKEK